LDMIWQCGDEYVHNIEVRDTHNRDDATSLDLFMPKSLRYPLPLY